MIYTYLHILYIYVHMSNVAISFDKCIFIYIHDLCIYIYAYIDILEEGQNLNALIETRHGGMAGSLQQKSER